MYNSAGDGSVGAGHGEGLAFDLVESFFQVCQIVFFWPAFGLLTGDV